MRPAVVVGSVSFPLTLALSRRERDTASPAATSRDALDWRKRGGRFSLSPRERAGERRCVFIGFPCSVLSPLVPHGERMGSLMQPWRISFCAPLGLPSWGGRMSPSAAGGAE